MWLGAGATLGLALWAGRGVLDVVSGPAGLERAAMLPPWSALVTAVGFLVAIGVVARRRGLDADPVLPLFAAGVLALPYLPWLADRLPLLRGAAGPGRFLLLAVLAATMAARLLPAVSFRIRPAAAPMAVFLTSLAVFGAAASRLAATPYFPGGDEPHYLVITQSLLRDGDLRIANNHERGDYREYFNRPLKPDYLALGRDGAIYSVHPIGLPLLALPAFAVGGYRGVVLMLTVMAALAALLLWRSIREATGSSRLATLGWASVALTTPFVFNSLTVYPEIPAALAVMIAMAWRVEWASTGSLVVRGLAIASLPWLSTKYAPMAAALTAVVVLRAGLDRRVGVATIAPVALSFAGWFAFFYWIWGSMSPSAPYGQTESMTLQTFLRGVPGLLFDQEYGVVAHAPILVLAIPGFFRMMQSGRAEVRRAIEIMVVFAALLVTVGAFRLWWGGASAPGRPVVAALLLLGVPIASAFAGADDRPAVRACWHVLLALSLTMAATFVIVQAGALAHNDRDGSAAFLDWLSPTWPLWTSFPSFIAGSIPAAAGRTLAWLALVPAVVWIVERCRASTPGAATMATVIVGFAGAVVLAEAVGFAARREPFVPEARSRVDLLDRFDATERPVTIVYDPWRPAAAAEALSRVLLVARPGLRTASQPVDVLWNARFALPSGEYRFVLTRPPTAPPEVTIAWQIGRSGPPLESWRVEGMVWEHRFVVPLDTDFVGFRAPASVARDGGELQVTPVTVINERDRVGGAPVIGASRRGAVTIFFHDDFVFPEQSGYWTRGRSRTHVSYVTPLDSADSIDIAISCGPSPTHVSVTTPGGASQILVEPGHPQRVSLPTRTLASIGLRVSPLELSVAEGFVPAEIDPSSGDRRLLGCRVE